jgi:hypothetical protein
MFGEAKILLAIITSARVLNASLELIRVDRFPKLYKIGQRQIRDTSEHNIRPAGQIQPTEAFNLSRGAQNFVCLACFFHKNILGVCKNL